MGSSAQIQIEVLPYRTHKNLTHAIAINGGGQGVRGFQIENIPRFCTKSAAEPILAHVIARL